MRPSTFVDGMILANMLTAVKKPITTEDLHKQVESNRVPGTPISLPYFKRRLNALRKRGILIQENGHWLVDFGDGT